MVNFNVDPFWWLWEWAIQSILGTTTPFSEVIKGKVVLFSWGIQDVCHLAQENSTLNLMGSDKHNFFGWDLQWEHIRTDKHDIKTIVAACS